MSVEAALLCIVADDCDALELSIGDNDDDADDDAATNELGIVDIGPELDWVPVGVETVEILSAHTASIESGQQGSVAC